MELVLVPSRRNRLWLENADDRWSFQRPHAWPGDCHSNAVIAGCSPPGVYVSPSPTMGTFTYGVVRRCSVSIKKCGITLLEVVTGLILFTCSKSTCYSAFKDCEHLSWSQRIKYVYCRNSSVECFG